MHNSIPDPEALLADSFWVNTLARRMVCDEQLAQDVVQESWLSALRRPNDRVDNWSAWLAGIVKNTARRTLRTRMRSAQREQERAAIAHANVPSPQEVLEREEARRRLVSALLGLEEPYRSTLVLRFYEDLEPSEIAARMNLPAATVRTRLKRGLSRMRDRLEDQEGPESSLSVLALLVPAKHKAGAAAGASGMGLVGGWLLYAKLPVTVGVVALAVLWIGIGAGNGPQPDSAGLSNSSSAHSNQAAASVEQGAPKQEGVRIKIQDARLSAQVDSHWNLSMLREAGDLRGRILMPGSDLPAAGARVSIVPSVGGKPHHFRIADERSRVVRERVTNAKGEFNFTQLLGGIYQIQATDEKGGYGEGYGVTSLGGDPVTIKLTTDLRKIPIENLPVHVLDAKGQPVSGALVTLFGSGGAPQLGSAEGWSLRTNAEGQVQFKRAHLLRGSLFAEGVSGLARADLAGLNALERLTSTHRVSDGTIVKSIPLVLASEGEIKGKVQGGFTGMRVSAWARSRARSEYVSYRIEFDTKLGEDNSFAIEGLAAGTYLLTTGDAPGLRMDLSMRTGKGGDVIRYQPLSVEVVGGEIIEVDITLVPAPVLKGLVLDTSGNPIVGARVHAVLPQGLISDPGHSRAGGVHLWRYDSGMDFDEHNPLFAREVLTDESGQYEFTGLLPSPQWRIEVFASGWTYDRVEDLELKDDHAYELEHKLIRAGGIQGIGPSWKMLGLRRQGEVDIQVALKLPRTQVSPFTVVGLEPGTWEIHSLKFRSKEPSTSYGTVEVVAGELTWIDLRTASPHFAEGRVLWRGRPMPGVELNFFGPSVMSDHEGRFKYHYAHPYSGRRGFDLSVVSEPTAVPLRVYVQGMCAPGATWSQDLVLPEGSLDLMFRNEVGHGLQVEVLIEGAAAAADGLGELRGLGYGGSSVDVDEQEQKGRISYEAANGWRKILRRSTAEGRIVLDMLPLGNYQIRARSKGGTYFEPFKVQVGAKPPGEMSIELGPGGRLEAKLFSAAGIPLPNEQLWIERSNAKNLLWNSAPTSDARGCLNLEHLPVGTYLARMNAPANAPIPYEGSSVSFEILANQTTSIELVR